MSEFLKCVLAGKGDVRDAQGKLIKDLAAECGIDIKRIQEKA